VASREIEPPANRLSEDFALEMRDIAVDKIYPRHRVLTLTTVVVKPNGDELMSKATDDSPEQMQKVDVPIVGFERSIPILITYEELPEGEEIVAPDTRSLRVFVAHDRGTNYHGSLHDDFFVCGNNGYDNNWTILWTTSNASQEDDDVQRLKPFYMLCTTWQPDDLDDKLASLIEMFDAMELNALLLLWAYAHYAAKYWLEHVGGGQLASSMLLWITTLPPLATT
jgi:hypothetical protein